MVFTVSNFCWLTLWVWQSTVKNAHLIHKVVLEVLDVTVNCTWLTHNIHGWSDNSWHALWVFTGSWDDISSANCIPIMVAWSVNSPIFFCDVLTISNTLTSKCDTFPRYWCFTLRIIRCCIHNTYGVNGMATFKWSYNWTVVALLFTELGDIIHTKTWFYWIAYCVCWCWAHISNTLSISLVESISV